MEQVIPYLLAHGLEIVGAVVMILNGLIAIALLVPGAEPETFLKKVVDFIGKFSRK